jgi:hypothetical protein
MLTYAQIVALTAKMVETRAERFSKPDYNDIVYSCERDVILARLLQVYPPLKFKLFYDRARQAALAERQAQQARGGELQQIINVHDPLFSDSRRATRLWLQKQEGVASAESIQEALQTEYKQHFLTIFEQQLYKGFIATLYPELGKEKHIKVTQDFRDFIEYLFGSYRAGATGGDTLIQSLQAALNRDTKDAQEDALMILFSSLNQARTAYEGSASKYIAAAHPLSKGEAREW